MSWIGTFTFTRVFIYASTYIANTFATSEHFCQTPAWRWQNSVTPGVFMSKGRSSDVIDRCLVAAAVLMQESFFTGAVIKGEPSETRRDDGPWFTAQVRSGGRRKKKAFGCDCKNETVFCWLRFSFVDRLNRQAGARAACLSSCLFFLYCSIGASVSGVFAY